FDGLVRAGTGQQVAFWRKRDVVDIRGVFGQRPSQLAGRRVPELDGLVAATARQNLPVRREGDAQHRAPMPLELSRLRIGSAVERRDGPAEQTRCHEALA